MRFRNIIRMTTAFIIVFGLVCFAQTSNFRLEPSGIEISLYPGGSATTGFAVVAGRASTLRDGLILSLADWDTDRNGIVIYREPGTNRNSASAWITIQPIILPTGSGDARSAKLTIKVPEDAAPGLYTSAVLVEEHVAVTKADFSSGASKTFRAFTIYVNVRPGITTRRVDRTSGLRKD